MKNKFRTFCYWANILLLVSLIVILITAKYPVREEEVMYQQQAFNQYQYWNDTIEVYNASMPPWKECNYDWFPAVCYWHNVPPTREQIYLHQTNPPLAWLYDYESVITIILLILVISVNGVLLWMKYKPTDLK